MLGPHQLSSHSTHTRSQSVGSRGTGTAGCLHPEVRLNRPHRLKVQCFKQQAATCARGVHNKVKLSFKLPYRCSFGQELCLVGSGDTLGNWSPDQGKRMHWTDGDVWEVDFEISAGPAVELEYKYVVRNTDGGVLCWKPGENCQIKVPVLLEEDKAIAEGVLVKDAWDGSIQDIELEVTGYSGGFTAEEERAAVESAVDRALHELTQAMSSSVSIQDRKQDPTAPELLHADRLVAAAARKAVAMHRALEASKALQALPVNFMHDSAAEQLPDST